MIVVSPKTLCAAAALAACASGTWAADWSDTSIGYRTGTRFAEDRQGGRVGSGHEHEEAAGLPKPADEAHPPGSFPQRRLVAHAAAGRQDEQRGVPGDRPCDLVQAQAVAERLRESGRILAAFSDALEKAEAIRKTVDPARFIDLHIDEIRADQVACVERIYAHFGIPVTEAARAGWRSRASQAAYASKSTCRSSPIRRPARVR